MTASAVDLEISCFSCFYAFYVGFEAQYGSAMGLVLPEYGASGDPWRLDSGVGKPPERYNAYAAFGEGFNDTNNRTQFFEISFAWKANSIYDTRLSQLIPY